MSALGAGTFVCIGMAVVTVFTVGGIGRANATPSLQVPLNPITVDSFDPKTGAFAVALPFYNRSAEPVNIVGVSGGCAGKCATVLPLTVLPGQVITLEIHSRFPAGARNGVVSVPVFTTDAVNLVTRVRFVAQR